MDKWLIRGGRTLHGEVLISGAKNAALPQLCAALLTADAVTLTNVPQLQDVSTMLKLIRNMGVSAQRDDNGTVLLNAGQLMSNPPSSVSTDPGSRQSLPSTELPARNTFSEGVPPGAAL